MIWVNLILCCRRILLCRCVFVFYFSRSYFLYYLASAQGCRKGNMQRWPAFRSRTFLSFQRCSFSGTGVTIGIFAMLFSTGCFLTCNARNRSTSYIALWADGEILGSIKSNAWSVCGNTCNTTGTATCFNQTVVQTRKKDPVHGLF